MKRFYSIFRVVIITLLVLFIAVPMIVYVLLSLPFAQNIMCSKAETELSRLLNTPVSINSLAVSPFNRVTLRGVVVTDTVGDTIMTVRRLGAGVNPFDAISSDNISIDYAEIVELNLKLSKANPKSPLNIDHIIKALSSKDENKPKSNIKLDIKTIVIRSSEISYDILSVPAKESGFDNNHISISELRADVTIPQITSDTVDVSVKRISFIEKSGFNVADIHADAKVAKGDVFLSNVLMQLPNSSIAFGDIAIDKNKVLNIKTLEDSHLTPSDFSAFYSGLSEMTFPVNADIDVTITENKVDIKRLTLDSSQNNFKLSVSGSASDIKDFQTLSVQNAALNLKADGYKTASALKGLPFYSKNLANVLHQAKIISVITTISGDLDNSQIKGKIGSAVGDLIFDGNASFLAADSVPKLKDVDFTLFTENFNLGKILNKEDLGITSLNATGFYSPKQRKQEKQAQIQVDVPAFDFKGYRYSDISINAELLGDSLQAEVKVADPNLVLDATLLADLNKEEPKAFLSSAVSGFNPYACNLLKEYEGYKLSGKMDCGFIGEEINDAIATLIINDLKFESRELPSLLMENLTFSFDGKSDVKEAHLTSDFLDFDAEGHYKIQEIPGVVSNIMSMSLPTLVKHKEIEYEDSLNVAFNATIKYNEMLNDFLHLPVNIIYPVTIGGTIDSGSSNLSLDVSAPYLQQKDKLIENSSLNFSTKDGGQSAQLIVTTNVPTKEGAMNLVLDCIAADDRIDTDLSWKINRKRLYEGNVDISTLFYKTDDEMLAAKMDINSSKMTFNDTTWTVNPATVSIMPKRIEVSDFDVRRENQFVTLQGVASDNPEDELTLNILNVNLDYIFESLGIDKALLGGDATGTFYAHNIFTQEPSLVTPGLFVKNISYNKVVFGDAIVKSHWDNEKREITLDADIDQPNGLHSIVKGGIFPLNDSLDINFYAKKINVAFLKPYMEAFTSDVSGIASGHARLFGTFKYIDLEGDIYAENLKLKIDFTNTYYSAEDSIHIKPGLIKVDNIQLSDAYGNHAMLNGEVRHKFFKEPEFDFFITDAKNFLSYDINSNLNPDWYGRIFGNGGATIRGVPGVVDIYVDMTTAPKSTFTFVLSDQEVANEYSFITFRDRNKISTPDTTNKAFEIPPLVRKLKERMNKTQDASSSVYNMTIQVNVTPEAQLILVMDPVGGDKIKANGTGNLRMDYGSANEDLRMYGKYVLDKGSYNFTLQDIILKDFTIKEGSEISFNGDPYAAQLNLKAFYSLNANLSDLDESFLQDKDLNRTNVPVHALMFVTGDIRSPGVEFDLEFPTLTSDTYRKVKSIVSTEDMMNRQIIYLLALNRFYTPDYMGSTTKGNELVSVASSTISSQLSSMLGELSDNWTIAPNFRSDKGDFSDVEVDLALSSSLLNNRLLFNGNFGYRDNSLNSNQFVGDFDLEYLLNKSGSLRLKAYNRYNDQNFYVKTATTTQGIGIVYRRDFDHMLSFLHRLKQKRKIEKERKAAEKTQADSVFSNDNQK